jgi:hypothetical protein
MVENGFGIDGFTNHLGIKGFTNQGIKNWLGIDGFTDQGDIAYNLLVAYLYRTVLGRC